MISPSAATALRIVGTIFHSLALGSTAFRLTHRYRRGRFWWDDFWALISVLLDIVLFVCLWVRAYYMDCLFQRRVGPEHIQHRVAVSWIMVLTAPCVLWSARISIGFTILRLLPVGLMRRVAVAAVSLFFVMLLALLAQVGWICGSDSAWHRSRSVDCRLGASWTISKLTTDIAANIFLVVTPLRLLWKSRLPTTERRIIGTVFAMSTLTTAISVVQAVYVLGPDRIVELYVAQFEAAFSLVVCNLLVITTCCYRAIRRRRAGTAATVFVANVDTSCPSPAGLGTEHTLSLTDVSISTPMALGSSSTFQTDLPDHPPGAVNPGRWSSPS